MNPAKVDRSQLNALTDLPNIGKAGAADLRLLGIDRPTALISADPFDLYERLCTAKGMRIDPCMLDVLISVTRFMAGEDARPWWAYSAERKAMMKEKSAP